MIKRWSKNVSGFLSAVSQMTLLAWEAQKGIFVGLIFLEIIQGFMPLLTAWITKEIFDLLASMIRGDSSANFVQNFLPLLVLQGVLSAIGQMIGQSNTYFNNELGRQLQLKTQAIIYDRVAGLQGLAYFENPKFHDIWRLASQGIFNGPSQILNTFALVIRNTITLSSFFGALLFLSPLLALLIAVASLPQLIVRLKIGRQRFGMMFMNSPKERQAMYFGQVLSAVNFAKEIRLFGLKNYFLSKFLQTTRDIQSTQRQQQLREMRWQLGLGILSSVVMSIAFIIVVSQAFNGRITIGEVTLYSSALVSVQAAVATMVLAFSNLNESILFFSRYTDLIALPPALTITDSPHPVPPLQNNIEFRNVSFRYTDQHPWVLKKINLSLPKGQCLALVGLNGAGKTTLVKLLTRLYDPTEGEILWDGTDIREFDPIEYQQCIGAIFQDFVHYDLTVQENIGLGNVDDIDNLPRIHQAAQDAGVHDFIQGLEKGYQTVLSRWLVEDGPGVDLSGGQWQKMAIARMFMRDASFLILDEPTAALDAEAEYEIYSHFANLVSSRTSLIISHRFSTVLIADKIAVLNEGEIVEYGTHTELLANGKTYAKLFMMQAEQFLKH